MASVRLFRVILPVLNIADAEQFYSALLEQPGFRVSAGRHYFQCGGVIVALYNPGADGDYPTVRPNSEHVYFAVDDLEAVFAPGPNALADSLRRSAMASYRWGRLPERPWGERSFYTQDPSGNPLCFVDETTLFTGPTPRP